MIKIENQRTVLREYKDSDLESVLLFTGDPEIAAHSYWGPLSRAETIEFLRTVASARSVNPRLNYGLAIVLKSKDEVIGHASLNIRNLSTKEAEIGYSVRRDLWGQGYASEAARAIVHFGFNDLGLHRIFATTSPLNLASQKVLEKIGFKHEGYLRKNVLQRGHWRDSLLYVILEEDWLSILSKTAAPAEGPAQS